MFLSQVVSAEAALGPFLKLKIINPDHDRRIPKDHFENALQKVIRDLQAKDRSGICFLFDGGDYFVAKPWADDAFSYFRGLIDSGDPLSPYLGLILSGFRGVKAYKQRAGSALYNIGSVAQLGPFTDAESNALIRNRCMIENRSLPAEDIAFVVEQAGGHPYLVQQVLSAVLDRSPKAAAASVQQALLRNHAQDFSDWWNAHDSPDGCGQNERDAYRLLIQRRKLSVASIAESTRLAEFEALDALECLTATGITARADEETFEVGSRLFAEWVLNATPSKPTVKGHHS